MPPGKREWLTLLCGAGCCYCDLVPDCIDKVGCALGKVAVAD